MTIPPIRPGRRIDGISAVLLPYTLQDTPDWEGLRRLLDRTWTAGLTPAVNMDTGYVHLLTDDERERVLTIAAEVGGGRRFVAGAFVEGQTGDSVVLYRREIDRIRRHGGTPVVFQSRAFSTASDTAIVDLYSQIAEAGGPLIGFELGPMFAPFGRIYSLEVFERILDIEAFVGLKHSSLDRMQEWSRLEMRDRHRPGFSLFTGNDLAIDMVFYGSDYLLGLSAFSVEGFARRDQLWGRCDPRAIAVNDVLQYLGQLAFRAPVPAYKHSAAQFLHLTGKIATAHTHPRSPRRPETDVALLGLVADQLNAVLAAAD